MVIGRETTTFYGLPVRQYEGNGLAAGSAARIALDYDSETSIEELLEALVAEPNARELRALLIGSWGEPGTRSSEAAVGAIVSAAKSLPALRAVFLGDMTFEECEISWIEHGKISPLFGIPNLEEIWVRGGEVVIDPFEHASLKKLVFQSGGLPGGVPAAVGRSRIPALEHLELWLGTDEYGGASDPEVLDALLSAKSFPKLRYLGLRNSVMADAIAARLCTAAILDGVETLDLSLGTLGDEGVQALAGCARINSLRRIDIHHHYASDESLAALRATGVELVVDGDEKADDVDPDDDYRSVAHSE